MELTEILAATFLRQALSKPLGRAFILNTAADAEDNGEARIFDNALAKVDDPKLAKMIERHRDDEIRHSALFRECRDRTGVDPGPVPDDIKMLDALNRRLDHFLDRAITDDRGVAETYLILQVIEERAIQQFAVMEPLFRKYDAHTANVFAEVARDEARHLRYCRAISSRYAPSEQWRELRLSELRRVEAQSFLENNRAYVGRLVEIGVVSRWFGRLWLGITDVAHGIGLLPYTRFHASKANRVRARPFQRAHIDSL